MAPPEIPEEPRMGERPVLIGASGTQYRDTKWGPEIKHANSEWLSLAATGIGASVVFEDALAEDRVSRAIRKLVRPVLWPRDPGTGGGSK